MTDPTDTNETRQLIADLRGGVPEKCDWCGKRASYLEPEEAGDWVCHACLWAFESEMRSVK